VIAAERGAVALDLTLWRLAWAVGAPLPKLVDEEPHSAPHGRLTLRARSL